jgi:predicted ester cyclase
MTTAETTARQVLRRMFDEGFSTATTPSNRDTIWVRALGRGTATGPFFGAPSGRPLDFTVIDVARVVDGRIVEHWGVPDRFAVLAQTGVLARLA